jgi:hypothetical protein
MKHPASTAAVLLLGLASLVGGATWLLSDSDGDDGQAALVPEVVPSDEVGFVSVTPKEQRKAVNIERTLREFKQIKEIGQEISEDLYMIPDANGDPTYYSTQLLKGVGRNGEPLFLSAQMKKTRTLPLRDAKKYIAPEPAKFRKEPLQGVLTTGKDKNKGGGQSGTQPPGDAGGSEPGGETAGGAKDG